VAAAAEEEEELAFYSRKMDNKKKLSDILQNHYSLAPVRQSVVVTAAASF